jgi:Ni/Co efflux regulator RcnB
MMKRILISIVMVMALAATSAFAQNKNAPAKKPAAKPAAGAAAASDTGGTMKKTTKKKRRHRRKKASGGAMANTNSGSMKPAPKPPVKKGNSNKK